ncbi:MAG: beta-Ala-His dipeptidase [Candidatus Hodarchaeales archaeon]|jgi:dipeptidase D
MPQGLKDLEPKLVWDLFEQISKIPRPSKKEEKIRAWIREWATNHEIKFKEDSSGNILLNIAASEGCEDYPTLILQAHIDMVCQKLPEHPHNFDEDPISIKLGEDAAGSFVTAEGTTLGADNGIGMAIALAAISKSELERWGPLEVLLTVDEETGLTGAFAVETGFFSGKYLLNLDSEDFAEITISAAGGGETQFSIPITKKSFAGYQAIKLKVQGLIGGHSGVDIHLPRSNAIKLLVSGLTAVRENVPISLGDINGGTAHNAIPRNAEATFMFPSSELDKVVENLDQWKQMTLNTKLAEDTGLEIHFEESMLDSGLRFEDTDSYLNLLSAIPHGPQSFSPEIDDLVETSNNLAIVATHADSIEIVSSTRSSINEELDRVRSELKELGERHAAMVTLKDSYPGWNPDLTAPLLNLVHQKYEEVIGREAKLRAIHAGLECGLFTRLDPDLQIVSIGPEIKDPHSPKERVYVDTVAQIWQVVAKTIEDLNKV